MVQNHVQRRRSKRATKKRLKPQYQNCQGKDIYQLDSYMRKQASLFETEAKASCMDCTMQTNDQSLEDLAHAIPEDRQQERTQNQVPPKKPEHTFKEKLKKRVTGLIQSKIAETERLKACMQGDSGWFAKKTPQADWLLIEEVCKKDKQALAKSIKVGWREMRISMALTSVNPDQIVTGKPHLSFPLRHEVSSFGSIKKLNQQEKKQAKEVWARYLTKTSVKTLSPSQFEEAFLKEDGRFLGKNLSTNDLKTLRKDTRQMQEESRDHYRQILEEIPLLAYLKTGDPDNQEDIERAFSKMIEELNDSLEKIKAKDVDMGVLLSFKPLVEGLLEESKGGYCLVAERARSKAEKEESLKKKQLLALGVLSAVPCFLAGPVGAVSCLGAGLGVGWTGYTVAKTQTKDSLSRALMGKEYERIAELAEQDREKFWELILLPTAGFGTTAGAIKGMKSLAQGKNKNIRVSADSRKSSAQNELKRNLSDKELSAIERAHRIGLGEKGKDGKISAVGNYTQAQLRKKRNILAQAGFSKKEIRTLMEKGIVGKSAVEKMFREVMERAMRENNITPPHNFSPGHSSVLKPAGYNQFDKEITELSIPHNFDTLEQRYEELAKKYDPALNGGNPNTINQFEEIKYIYRKTYDELLNLWQSGEGIGAGRTGRPSRYRFGKKP